MISEALYRRARATLAVGEAEPVVTVEIPLTLPSRANKPVTTRGARMDEARRHKSQRNAAYLALCGPVARLVRPRAPDETRLRPPPPLAVRMVRIAPRTLDDDNLAAALKSVRDGIASVLRVDDRDPRVTWVADQLQGHAASVLVEVYRL